MGSIDIGEILGLASTLITSKHGQTFLCGTYSDGRPRSVVDAWRDEVISPKDREKWEKKKKKKKKAAKKKKKRNSDFYINLSHTKGIL